MLRKVVDVPRSRHHKVHLDRFRTEPKPGDGWGDERAFPIVTRERRARRVLANLESLPMLPGVVAKVMQLAHDADAKASDFEAIIRRDPALAVKVLRFVNSPFFGLRHRVTSISHAVVLLGFKTIRSVVIAAKTSHLLNRQLTHYGLDAGGMWKHSISCATICHFLGKELDFDRDAQEELFVAGLLHDVGKIVIAPHVSALGREFGALLVRHEEDVVAAENELLGIAHDEVSWRMAVRWNLDPDLSFLMRSHHRRDEIGPDTRGLHLLQVADDLCHQLGIGRRSGPREPSPLYPAWLEVLDVGEQGRLLREVERALAELEEVFESIVRAEGPRLESGRAPADRSG